MSAPRVGVLSLQGDFAAHAASLAACGAAPVEVTRPGDFDRVAALVLPGGESTTMLRLLAATDVRAPLERWVASRPVLGTCAGLILLGRGAERLPAPPLGALDVDVSRNAYGRQIDSFIEPLAAPALGGAIQGVFIRAPRIVRVGAGVEVVARRVAPDGGAGEPVGVRQGRLCGLAFHPELTADPRVHRWFLAEVAGVIAAGGAAEDAVVGGAA